jgi:iron complex outermembrane recepter protein
MMLLRGETSSEKYFACLAQARSRRSRRLSRLARGAIGVGLVHAMVAPAWGQEAPTGGMQEIVVTAQKRTEKLVNVPSSIAVLSSSTLKTQGINGFNDYQTLVPGLASFSQGGSGFGTVILRGMSTGYAQLSNTVAYYVDDTPYSLSSPLASASLVTPDPDLADVDRLEVLEGPQSTLYGASSLGGLVKISLKRPDLTKTTAEVDAEGTAVDGGGLGYGGTAVLNIPIINDKLAIRLNAYDRSTPGYMSNVDTGQNNLGGSHREGGRIALRWKPIDGLDIQINATKQHSTTNGWTLEFVNPVTLAPIYGYDKYATHLEAWYRSDVETYSASINYDIAGLGTITSATSFNHFKGAYDNDWTGTYAPSSSLAPVQPVPADAAVSNLSYFDFKKTSQELRLTTKRLGNFEGIVGGYFTYESVQGSEPITNVAQSQPIPPADVNVFYITPTPTYREFSGFINLTYHFHNVVDITGGLRYSTNNQTFHTCQSGYLVENGCFYNTSSDHSFTYLGSVIWHLTQATNVYARIATAYRPGGPQEAAAANVPTSFGPDSVTNYEVGLKGSWLDNHVRANLALFTMDWNHVQLTYLDPVSTLTFVMNAGKARVNGVELQASLVPVDGLTLTANGAYNDGKLTQVAPEVTAATGAVAGNRLPYTSPVSGSITADYEHPLRQGLTASFGATWRYQGDKHTDYPGDAYNTDAMIPAFNTTDLRAGLHWTNYDIGFRIGNLFNSHGITSAVNWRSVAGDNSVPTWANVIMPRNFTLSFKARY